MTAKSKRSRIPMPRLLPVTMVAMVCLLVLKSGHLVLAATGSPEHAVVPPAKAETAKAEPSMAETSKAVSPPAPAPAPPADPPVSEAERALLTDLRQRRLALDQRSTDLSAREAALAAVERRLSGRVDELTSLQARLETLERQRKEHDEANWRGLVKLYETMKPRDAATIFNDLDLPVLLPVLDRMKEARAAAVLSAMSPDRARLVTSELAQLRAKANTVAPAGG